MKNTFERVSRFSSGYSPEEVDDFLDRAKAVYTSAEEGADMDEKSVRDASFSWVHGGYKPELVDAALDRLERAFIRRRRAHVMTTQGEDAWLDATYKLASSLYPRLQRPAGERFEDATGAGYAKNDVDALIDTIAQYFDGKQSLTSQDIRDVVFASAKKAQAYDEALVDVYLDRVVSVLLAVE